MNEFDDRKPRSCRDEPEFRARVCSLGGGGSSGGSTTQHFEPPENTREGWNQYMQNAQGLSGQPFQQSPYPTVAPWNDFQQTASNLIYDQAVNGDPSSNAGRGALTGIASGNQANPWQAFMANTAGGGNQNPFLSGLQNFNNPFMGGMQQMAGGQMNPNTIDPQAFIDSTTKDMTRAAQEGTMAQTDAAANRAGAYGGSAHSQMQADNANALADSVGQMSQSAKLSAAGHNAGLWQQNQQNRLGAMGLGNQAQGLNLQSMMGGGGLFDQGVGRQLQAAMGGGSMFNQDIGNMLSAAGLAPQYAQMDSNAFQNLFGMGQAQNQYQQGLLNAGNQSFQQQMMYPWTMNEMFGGALTRASGQGGSSTSTMMQPGYNPYMNAAGVGAGLYGMFG